MKKNFHFLGRPDGIGNRVEEIINLECICAKENSTCNYIWINKHKHRSYDPLIKSTNVIIKENIDKKASYIRLSDFSHSFTQREFLFNAKSIAPTNDIYFENGIKPIGVHIRGTDRIGKVRHPHQMKNKKEFYKFLEKTIEILNHEKPQYAFVCADHDKYKKFLLNRIAKEICLVTPTCRGNMPASFSDFFALAQCSKIYMSAKFSSYSIVASLIGNIPIVSYTCDDEVAKRYKALFQYELLE